MKLMGKLNRPYKTIGSIVERIPPDFIDLGEKSLDDPIGSVDPIRWFIEDYLSDLVESNLNTKVGLL